MAADAKETMKGCPLRRERGRAWKDPLVGKLSSQEVVLCALGPHSQSYGTDTGQVGELAEVILGNIKTVSSPGEPYGWISEVTWVLLGNKQEVSDWLCP